jgi:hypothetical protein
VMVSLACRWKRPGPLHRRGPPWWFPSPADGNARGCFGAAARRGGFPRLPMETPGSASAPRPAVGVSLACRWKRPGPLHRRGPPWWFPSPADGNARGRFSAAACRGGFPSPADGNARVCFSVAARRGGFPRLPMEIRASRARALTTDRASLGAAGRTHTEAAEPRTTPVPARVRVRPYECGGLTGRTAGTRHDRPTEPWTWPWPWPWPWP